jgi:hypothetical protein
MSSGRPPRQQIQRRQRRDHERGHRQTRGAPAGAGDQALQPRQDHDRADAHARERDADRQAAAANEPVRQEERVTGVAKAHRAAGHEHAERQIEMPGRRHERSQAEPGADHHDAQQHDRARTAPVDQAAQHGPENRRGQETERERTGREPARPAELVQDRREHQRERRARVDADAHRHEGDGDDHPAVEHRKRS